MRRVALPVLIALVMTMAPTTCVMATPSATDPRAQGTAGLAGLVLLTLGMDRSVPSPVSPARAGLPSLADRPADAREEDGPPRKSPRPRPRDVSHARAVSAGTGAAAARGELARRWALLRSLFTRPDPAPRFAPERSLIPRARPVVDPPYTGVKQPPWRPTARSGLPFFVGRVSERVRAPLPPAGVSRTKGAAALVLPAACLKRATFDPDTDARFLYMGAGCLEGHLDPARLPGQCRTRLRDPETGRRAWSVSCLIDAGLPLSK